MSYDGDEISPSEWDEAERRDIDDGLDDGLSEDEDWDFDAEPQADQETGGES